MKEEIEKKYPCEQGQSVIMEEGKTYSEVIQANYYRRQGATWAIEEFKNSDDLVKFIQTMTPAMVEQFQRHDYRNMYEIWEMVLNKINTPK